MKWNPGDVAIGDMLKVTFPNTERPPFIGAVIRLYTSDIFLESAEIDLVSGEPLREELHVTRESLSFPEYQRGRHNVEAAAEYEVWAAGGLMSFGLEQPEIPQGLTLEELLRHNQSQFILAFNPAKGEWNPAYYRSPFYHAPTGCTVRQPVTVFALNKGARLERHAPDGSADTEYRHLLPDNASISRIDEGYVLGTGARIFGVNHDDLEDMEGQLALGHHSGPAGGLHWHNLKSGRYFAVETAVLSAAGIDLSA